MPKHHSRIQCWLVTNSEFKVPSQPSCPASRPGCPKHVRSNPQEMAQSWRMETFLNPCLFRTGGKMCLQRGCCRCRRLCYSWHSERSITYTQAVLLPLLSACLLHTKWIKKSRVLCSIPSSSEQSNPYNQTSLRWSDDGTTWNAFGSKRTLG